MDLRPMFRRDSALLAWSRMGTGRVCVWVEFILDNASRLAAGRCSTDVAEDGWVRPVKVIANHETCWEAEHYAKANKGIGFTGPDIQVNDAGQNPEHKCPQ